MKFGWALSILFGLTLAAKAQNLPVQGSCTMGGVQVQTQGILSTTRVTASYPRCNITVYNSGTVVPATIYSNGFGARLSNPFQANTDASWVFYIPSGTTVDVMMNGGTPVAMPRSVTVTSLQGGMWGGGLFGSNTGGGNGVPTGCTINNGGLLICPGFGGVATQPLPVTPGATYFDHQRVLSVGTTATPTQPGRLTLAGDDSGNVNYVNYLDCAGPKGLFCYSDWQLESASGFVSYGPNTNRVPNSANYDFVKNPNGDEYARVYAIGANPTTMGTIRLEGQSSDYSQFIQYMDCTPAGGCTIDVPLSAGVLKIPAKIASARNSATTPGTSKDTCVPDQMWHDQNYLYVCLASGNIKRVALSSF